MRVISGSARGKKLLCAEGKDIRPTLDRVKESIFNIIAFDVPESSILDMFSGSGALGIEALSRGAGAAVFLDCDETSVSVTKQNLNATRLETLATVIRTDSIEYVKSTDKKFDIIFVDPPYESDLYEKSLNAIKQNSVLTDDGFVLLEYDSVTTPEFDLCGFEVLKEKKYGRVKILILKG